MTPRQILQNCRAGIARLLPGSSPRADSQKSSHSLPVHHRMVLLGTWLLVSCAAVAAMGLWGLNVIDHEQMQLTVREVPALAQLLRTDVDLYEGQLGLERAAAATDASELKSGLDFWSENITQSNDKFTAFKALVANVGGDDPSIAAYEADRAAWVRATEKLASALSNRHHDDLHNAEPPPTIEATRPLFQAVRARLNHIIADIYEPAVEASGDRLDRTARQTRWKLLIGAVVALAGGVILTRRMARTLRIQQQAAEAMNVERAEQNLRQAFEARLARALEMAQDEDGVLRLVEQAIVIAAPEVTSEILLGDSSRAHLHQVAKTGHKGAGCGCRVPKPSDCPAVRRGHRLSFESGAMLDACPYLKDRPGGNRSAVCVPLSIMGQTVGVMHVTAADGHLPPAGHIQALEQVASKSGERIGLLRAFQRTQVQASIDPLTGLLNRRSLEEKVHELTRQEIPFAVAYGDLDHFKNLNDTHGHETGDKALRTFAQTIKSSIRPGDLAARWGGEEFVVVLPRASAGEGVAVLDRVRQRLANVLKEADTPNFTVSFGIAQTAVGALFVDVLASADESLLRAKKEGRDRTVQSSDLAPKANRSDPAPLDDEPIAAAAAA